MASAKKIAKFACGGKHERAARLSGFTRIAGVDEAGRGSLFGPVFAAAVILSPDRPIRGLSDSKLLLPERREVLAERIRERAVAWAVGGCRRIRDRPHQHLPGIEIGDEAGNSKPSTPLVITS